MTNEELKEAMLKHTSVILKVHLLGEVGYTKIIGIIYREEKGKIKVYGELLDKNRNSVTVAPADMIRCSEVG